MNTEDLAAIFDGLATGLQSGLKKSGEEGLRRLADMFRRFPSQSVQDYIKFVEGCLEKERTSVPVMVQRIKAAQAGDRAGVDELRADVDGLKAGDLKKLLTAVGQKAARTLQENRALARVVIGGEPATDRPSAQIQDGEAEFDALRHEFLALRDGIEDLALDEIRRRFESIRARDKVMLARLLTSLGYSPSGSKEDMEGSLLSILERRKVSSEQTGRI